VHNRSFTADTKAEVEYMVADFKRNKTREKRADKSMTVRQACERYIKLKALLSPTTLDGYNRIMRTSFHHLMEMRVDKLTDEIVQLEINKEALRIGEKTKRQVSAKYVINAWGLISASLHTICKADFDVTLPRRPHPVHEYPEPAAVFGAIAGTDVELPCLLAFWLSFTMSEIRGLRCSDIKDGTITINQVMVDAFNTKTIKEAGKTDSRLRMHRVPSYLMEIIEAQPNYQRYIQEGTDSLLIQCGRDHIVREFKKAITPIDDQMTFHSLRHMNASIMLALNVPTKYAMERGGWKTPTVMQNVYQHTFTKERIIVDNMVDSFFVDMIEGQKIAQK